MSVFLELPAFYIDEVVFDDLGLGAGAEFLAILNRNPEPSESQVYLANNIQLDLAADIPIPTTGIEIRITVTPDGGAPGSEVVAFDTAGAFASGWDGAASATSTPETNTRRYVIDPTVDFNSLDVVTVRVIGALGGRSIDRTYSFTIEDKTLPILLSATAQTKKTVRLLFDETMSTATAAVAANYMIARASVPSVELSVISVEHAGSIVDVTLDVEMTPGATYTITAAGVEDMFGNVIAAPDNVSQFVGFAPTVDERRSFQLYRMLQQKARDLDTSGELLKFLLCFQEPTDLLLCQIDRWSDILDPDICPADFLDAFLTDLGNPFDFELDDLSKRKLIRILVPIYKQKGTEIGIINVIRFFTGLEVTINTYAGEGWILGEDELGDSMTEGTAILGIGTQASKYSFEIESAVVLTDEQTEQIRAIADYMKPGHTHLIDIIDPTSVIVIDHLELGFSELGDNWILH